MSEQESMFENMTTEDHQPREVVSLWDLPPTSVQQGGAVKVWSFDSSDDLPASMRHRVNVSEWPNQDFGAPRLKEVLERQADKRFFLSPKACAGILNRAVRRGKNLPAKLAVDLKAGAGRAT